MVLWKDYGILLMKEIIDRLEFVNETEDTLTFTNTFGELPTLTGRVSSSTVIAETAARVLLIPREVILLADKKIDDPVNGYPRKPFNFLNNLIVNKFAVQLHGCGSAL